MVSVGGRERLPGEGEVLPLARTLPVAPDPLALFAALTDGGRAADCALLESGDPTAGLAERSFLFPRAALRLTGRGRALRLEALTAGGRAALPAFAARLAARGAVEPERGPGPGEPGGGGANTGGEVVALAVRYAPPPAGDEATRLAAPGPLDALRALAGLTPLARPGPWAHGVVAAWAFDLLGAYERLPDVAQADPTGFPDLLAWVPESVLVVDPLRGRTTVVCPVLGGPPGPALEAAYHDASRRLTELALAVERVAREGARPGADEPAGASVVAPAGAGAPVAEVDLDDAGFAALVERLQAHVLRGDVFQIVPSRTFRAPCADPLAAYARLRRTNPSPYLFFARAAQHALFGASPETSVRVRASGPDGARPFRVQVRPIAGTAPRGRTPAGALDLDLDGRLEAELRLSEKELAEHMMLVDLARNDVARVSVPGTRHVPQLLAVDRYSAVMHLVSTVEGTLRPDLDAVDAVVASMTMGTLTGAPKLEAAALLRRVEPTRRGPYGGAIGYLTCDGELDSAIVIRSAVVVGEGARGVAHVRAGAGVVFDSDPAAEARETTRKAAAVLRALGATPPGEGA